MSIAKHRIVLSPTEWKPIHLAPHQVGPNAREYQRNLINKMQLEGAREPDQTEWAALMVFSPKKLVLGAFASITGNRTLLRSGTSIRYNVWTNISSRWNNLRLFDA